jgi:putative transposase
MTRANIRHSGMFLAGIQKARWIPVAPGAGFRPKARRNDEKSSLAIDKLDDRKVGFYPLQTQRNLYLFVVEDIHDKEVVGYHMDICCGAEQATEALKQALIKRFGRESAYGLELIVRVDRGCQFTAHDYAEFAMGCGIKLEFCGVQTPNDKPYIESFIGCYKREEVYRNQYEDFFEAIDGWKRYLEWYHDRRPHGSLNNLPPAAFKLENSSTKMA